MSLNAIRPSKTRKPFNIPIWLSCSLDALATMLFAVIGRVNHGLSFSGFLISATPFLIALVIPWIIMSLVKRPANAWLQGLFTWLSTAILGQIIRALLYTEIAPTSFLLVSLCAIGVLFFTWRVLAFLWNKLVQ